jgi:hypothetical protein
MTMTQVKKVVVPAKVATTQMRGDPSHDAYEREADRVGEAVARGDLAPWMSLLPSAPMLQRKCAACTEDDVTLRRDAEAPDPRGWAAPPTLGKVLRSPGRPLTAATRAFMEPRFGRSFRNVRVHDDRDAAEAAQSVRARAFTVREHVAFGQGRYSPETTEGRRLLGHELAHVVQWAEGRLSDSYLGRQADGGIDATVAANPPKAPPPPPEPKPPSDEARLEQLKARVTDLREKRARLAVIVAKARGRDELRQVSTDPGALLDISTSAQGAKDLATKTQREMELVDGDLDETLADTLRLLQKQLGAIMEAQTASSEGTCEPATSTRDELRRQIESYRAVHADVVFRIESKRWHGDFAAYARRQATDPDEKRRLEDRAQKFLRPRGTPAGQFGTDPDGRFYVVYETHVKVGGTLPWRNNNPGNLRKGTIDVIGHNTQQQGRNEKGVLNTMAIYRTWEAGRAGMGRNLDGYGDGQVVKSVIRRYLLGPYADPELPNNKASLQQYLDGVSRQGIDTSQTIAAVGRDKLKNAMRIHEGGGGQDTGKGDVYTCTDLDGKPNARFYRGLLGCNE